MGNTYFIEGQCNPGLWIAKPRPFKGLIWSTCQYVTLQYLVSWQKYILKTKKAHDGVQENDMSRFEKRCSLRSLHRKMQNNLQAMLIGASRSNSLYIERLISQINSCYKRKTTLSASKRAGKQKLLI